MDGTFYGNYYRCNKIKKVVIAETWSDVRSKITIKVNE